MRAHGKHRASTTVSAWQSVPLARWPRRSRRSMVIGQPTATCPHPSAARRPSPGARAVWQGPLTAARKKHRQHHLGSTTGSPTSAAPPTEAALPRQPYPTEGRSVGGRPSGVAAPPMARRSGVNVKSPLRHGLRHGPRSTRAGRVAARTSTRRWARSRAWSGCRSSRRARRCTH